ncbi:hypothetical protein V6C53_15155, partial [Desulfocurvibacter africanus]|uniref:hypothetical protein n=1 Tax=Desulfocurvibacter africanus TaxID=873 RepID=UPI002FDA75E2
MNAYLNQLNNISQTLRDGIGAIARDRLNRSVMDLEDTRLDYGLAKDKREWDAHAPGLELERQKAQGELDRLNAPVRFTDDAPTPWAQEHFVWRPDPEAAKMKNTSFMSSPGAMGNRTASRGGFSAEDEQAWPGVPGGQPGQKIEPMLLSKVESLYGAKLDTRQGSPTYGIYIKPDGAPLTHREREGKREQLTRLIAANTSAYKVVRDREEALEGEIQTLSARIAQGRGDPAKLKQELAGKEAQLRKVGQWRDDPKAQMATLREQYDMYVAWGDPEAMKGAERVAGQMEKLQARIAAAEEKAYPPQEDERDLEADVAMPQQQGLGVQLVASHGATQSGQA